MRLKNLIKWDIQFQIKYGFYLIYALVTVLYIVLLSAFPPTWREKAAAIMIFSDPAAMGLFFMGAIVLLEKSQRVLNSLAVSPIKVTEYILSKVISIGVISVFVAFILAVAGNIRPILPVLIGTGLSSVMFTLLGLIAATKIVSLNQFILVTAPIEIICFAPPILYSFDSGPMILRCYPISLCMGMIMGKADDIFPGVISSILVIVILYMVVYQFTLKMWKSVGGAKL